MAHTTAIIVFTVCSLLQPGQSDPGQIAKPPCDVTEAELISLILRNYTKQSRPIMDPSKTVLVQIGLRLFAIKDFIERENTVIFEGYFTMNWYDEFIRWKDKPRYQCIESLVFDADQIWHPDIKMLTGSLLGNPNFLNAGEKIVASSSNASMYFYVMGEFKMRCELDVHLFPFDEQYCEFVVESWNYPMYMQMLRFIEPPFVRIPHFWTENEMWELADNATDIVNPVYVNDDGIYDRCIFKILLRRKPLYYFAHVIIPSIIITAAEIVTFLLPVQEYIKVHISFTCLLAYSVFEDMVMNEMPRSSKSVPLLSLYIDLQMAYIGVIALLGEGLVCIVLRQADAGKASPPDWLFKVFRRLGAVVFIEFKTFIKSVQYIRTKRKRAKVSVIEKQIEANYPKFSELLDPLPSVPSNYSEICVPTKSSSTHHQQLSCKEQWIFIAEVVERCNMWLYIIAIIVTPLVLITFRHQSTAAEGLKPHLNSKLAM